MADTSRPRATANFNISKFKDVIEDKQDGLTKGTFFVCNISPGAKEELPFAFEQDDLLVCKAVNLPAEQLNFTTLKYHTRAIKIPTTREFGPITLSFYNTGDYNLRTNFFKWMNMYNSAAGNLRGLKETYHLYNNVRTDKIAAANYGNFNGTNFYTKMFATMELFPFTNDGVLKPSDLLKVLGQVGIDAAQQTVGRIGGRVGGILGGAAGLAANHFKNKLQIESNNRPLASYKFTNTFPTNIGPLQFSYDDDSSFQTYDVEFQYLDMRYESASEPHNPGGFGTFKKGGADRLFGAIKERINR